MIHALHNPRGANIKDVGIPGLDAAWGDPEEFATIAGTEVLRPLVAAPAETSENALRDEHLIPQRHGHDEARARWGRAAPGACGTLASSSGRGAAW